MEPETNKNSPMFSLKSPFCENVFKIKENLYRNNRWKPLSIHQSDKIIVKLHGEVLEDDFPDTLSIFESNSQMISLPEEFNAECMEILVKYLYLHEIAPLLNINQTFSLLTLAVFFKLKTLTAKIQEFLINGIENEVEAQKIFKISLDYYIIFQKNDKGEILEAIGVVMSQSMIFLMKINKSEEIMKQFNANFFPKLQNNQIGKSFNFFLEIFKASGFGSNELLLEFFILYKNKLIECFQSEDANFNKEQFYQKFIQKNLDLGELNLKSLQNYMKKLEFEVNFEFKDIIINTMSDSIIACRKEIKELKGEVSKLKMEAKEFKQKVEMNQEDMENKIRNIGKNTEYQFKGFKKNVDHETKKSAERNERKIDEIEGKQLKMMNEFEKRIKILEQRLLNKEEEKHEETFKKSVTSNNETPKPLITSNITNSITFDNVNNNNGELLFSNSNTTVERLTQEGWSRVACTENLPQMKSSTIKTFSIKIEKTRNASIFYGFCIKKVEDTNGYHNNKLSFMLSIYNGKFCSRSMPSKYIKIGLREPAINSQIFSASLDLIKKTMKFYLNGKLLGPPKEIDLKPREAELMCPCVDIGDKGDKVSLVFHELE